LDVLVLQHIACEPPGAYEDVMLERDVRVHRVELDEGEPLPDWHDFDAIVAMGGPMSAGDDQELPWLREEKRAIGEAVRSGLPYFGACLGVQLLASSLGARVYRGPEPEVDSNSPANKGFSTLQVGTEVGTVRACLTFLASAHRPTRKARTAPKGRSQN
jgi:GMP synthase-like glutamine amidotransferase